MAPSTSRVQSFVSIKTCPVKILLSLEVVATTMLVLLAASLPTLTKAWVPAVRYGPSSLRIQLRGRTPPTRSASLTSLSAAASKSDTTSDLSAENLISLQDSLDIFNKEKEDKARGKVVFVDGSFYHKGNRNGRQE
jgi:hypothetical protein